MRDGAPRIRLCQAGAAGRRATRADLRLWREVGVQQNAVRIHPTSSCPALKRELSQHPEADRELLYEDAQDAADSLLGQMVKRARALSSFFDRSSVA